MKKIFSSRLLIFSVIGLISWGGVLGRRFSALTEPVNHQMALSSRVKVASLIWPTQGWISQGYKPNHEGIDIAGPIGSPIIATQAGEVIFSGWEDSGLGNVVKLKHIDGSFSIYGHNSHLLV
ncbi:MAG: M23 family metallopeptidase, partial [Moorea sp. SIO2B7]|nr:M23 family metallopeptidase [Moorena sp. SIO2B7]